MQVVSWHVSCVAHAHSDAHGDSTRDTDSDCDRNRDCRSRAGGRGQIRWLQWLLPRLAATVAALGFAMATKPPTAAMDASTDTLLCGCSELLLVAPLVFAGGLLVGCWWVAGDCPRWWPSARGWHQRRLNVVWLGIKQTNAHGQHPGASPWWGLRASGEFVGAFARCAGGWRWCVLAYERCSGSIVASVSIRAVHGCSTSLCVCRAY